MKAQVVSTRYPQLDENNDRHRRERGEIIEVSKEEFDRGVGLGVLRKPSDAPLPEPNVAAVAAEGSVPVATQPDGTPLELDEVVEETGFAVPKTHAEADAMATSFGVTFQARTNLDDKRAALRQVYDARAADTTPAAPPSVVSLEDLSDEELIQRGVDFGHEEDEMTELSHDELVTFVAEAQNRHSANPVEQATQVGSGGNTAQE